MPIHPQFVTFQLLKAPDLYINSQFEFHQGQKNLTASVKKKKKSWVREDNFNKFLPFAITLLLNAAIVCMKNSRQLFILI